MHTYDEEWIWNVYDQDYRILLICRDGCVGCRVGIPLE